MTALTLLAAGKIHWTESVLDLMNKGVRNLSQPWVLFGFAAQAVFASRFVLQWIASERAGRSIVPTAFWWLSIAGTLMLASYAAHNRDPVFILGQTLNTFIYVRNLMIIRRTRTDSAGSAAPG